MFRIVSTLTLIFVAVSLFAQTYSTGAQIPFVILEAEEAVTNGTIRSGRTDRTNPTYFASGRSLVELSSSNHYVSFASPIIADRLTIRYSIPYNTSGNIQLRVNNQLVQEVYLESFRMWGGPNYPGDTNRRPGDMFRMFDEIIVDVELKVGDLIELRKGNDASIPTVLIDFIDLEKTPAPLSMPGQGWLSVADFGITGTSQADVSNLINNVLSQAANQSKDVWFPPGEYYVERAIRIPNNVKIMGAGMWHTIIRKNIPATRFESAFIMGSGNSISNMMIDDVLGYKRIGGRHYGIELGSNGIVDKVWVRNTFGSGIKGEDIINTTIRNSRVYGSYPDAIHFKRDSKNCLVENSITRNSGDDGLAMVSYDATGMEKLHFINNTVFFNYWGRGISMIGGDQCIIEHNLVIDGASAGIVIGTNTFDGLATPFVTNFLVENNTVVRCGNVINQNQAGIWVWGNVAGSPLSGKVRYNTIIDPTRHCISLINRVGAEVHVVNNYLCEPGPNGQQIYMNLTSGFHPTLEEDDTSLAETHKFTVPGQYNNIIQAINQGVNNNTNVNNGDEVIITVLEGSISHGALLANISKSVKITVVGAGANKTYIVPANLPRRLINLPGTAAENIELIFRNLTFSGWGYPAGEDHGGVMNIIKNGVVITFENVVFEDNIASRGGVIRFAGSDQSISFRNCFFSNNNTIENAHNPDGQIFKQGTGTVTISESTFSLNQSNPVNNGVDPGHIRGNVLDILTSGTQQLSVALEKNTIVQNRFVNQASTSSIQPTLSFRSEDQSSISLSLIDNLLIENRRNGNNNDVDIYFSDPGNVILSSQGNIANRVMAMQNRGNADYTPPGFIVNSAFSFSHPAIDFIMDGDNPRHFLDNFGVPYFTYHGDGEIPIVFVENINLSAAATTVEIGSTLQVVAGILPVNADNKTVTWSVNNTNIATINGSGLLTGVSEGTVRITATANDGSGVTGTLDIKVEPIPPVLVSSISLSSTSDTVQVGETLQVFAEVLPEEADDKSITWNVDDSGVANIDDHGLLMAISEGAVRITATANDGSGVTGALDIKVEPLPPILVSEILLTSTSDSLQIGYTIVITANILPDNADNKEVVWGVSDESIATVSEDGMLTGLSRGEVIVNATSTDGSDIEAQIPIVIYMDDTSISDNINKLFSIYPNPSQGLFRINWNDNDQVEYTIYDLKGLLITSGRLKNEVSIIDIRNQPTGLYILQIKTKSSTEIFKISIISD